MKANEPKMKHYSLKREIEIDQEYDVVVAGGGPAGTAAAICAARQGCKTLLVEATGCLGGMGTSGLVSTFDPMGNGKRPLVGGLMREIIDRLDARNFLPPQVNVEKYMSAYHTWTMFSSEGLKLVLDEMAVNAGVEVRFFTKVIDADASEDTVRGVVLHNIEGYRYVPAKTFIDCTGDAVLADLCGVPCRVAGRDTPNINPATLASHHANIDWSVDLLSRDHFNQNRRLVEAIEKGHFTQPDLFLAGITPTGNTLACLNGGHIFHCDALNCRSLSDSIMLGRKIAQEYLAYYREYVPGCAEMELTATGSLLGIRESRRIVGEYELNFQDYQARRQFPDQIGVFNKFVDRHPYDSSKEEFERFEEEANYSGRIGIGECFGIPYSILVPRGWRNLWVAGRCNSSDVKMSGSIRTMPPAAMMGQAAGTAAAQSISTGQPACDLNTETLVVTLRAQGAYLPQETLSQTMTRAATKA